MVAHIQDSLTGNHLGLREYIIFCRFLLAVVLSAFFVPLTVLAADNFFRNRRVSVLTGFVAALSPMALGLSRFAYPDHYFIFSSALVLWLCSLNQKRALLIASFVCGLSMGIKY